MLIKQTNTALSSLGYELDCREEAFGYLRDSSDVLGKPEQFAEDATRRLLILKSLS